MHPFVYRAKALRYRANGTTMTCLVALNVHYPYTLRDAAVEPPRTTQRTVG